MLDLSHTNAYLAALGGLEAVYDFRAIHDTNRADYGQKFRGTIAQLADTLDQWNRAGYGIFVVVNETDGNGVLIENVKIARANFTDNDTADPGWAQFQAVRSWQTQPSFYVIGAVAGKFHAYWKIEPTADIALWQDTQRKLINYWNSDKAVSDPPRVMRLPGSLHMKGDPVVVQFVPGSGLVYPAASINAALSSVSSGPDTTELGEPSLSAPNLEWAVYALNKIDPNSLGRDDWIKLTAAFKQAAWLHGGDIVARIAWDAWSAKYDKNDIAENAKQWRSIRSTKAGWPMLATRSGAMAELKFGGQSVTAAAGATQSVTVAASTLDRSAAILTPEEQQEYFKGCIYVERMGRILTPNRRYLDPGKFNGAYGGKLFIYDALQSKTTDEPWKAATRGQVFRVQRVDHTRFLPLEPSGTMVRDELGRLGLNTYVPANVRFTEGDASPFTSLLRLLLADERDVRILINYMAHIVQRPGVKAFWAPVIQSVEGAGKGVIGEALTYAVGSIYTHAPNAKELVDAGSKFNSWMRDKLLIIANEIRVDEKRDMLDVLKPLITEARIEVQSKGIDQEMEDNVSNWLMFTNFKDAVPVTRDSRRYAIFYSPLQSIEDLTRAGLTGGYWPKLYTWLRTGGREHVAWFLRHWPIEAEYDPAGAAHRAPDTSSHSEAIVQSYGLIEQKILEAVDSGVAGFKNGWLSSAAVSNWLREQGLKTSPNTLSGAFRNLGYNMIGRHGGQIFEEQLKQPYLWNLSRDVNLANYRHDQNYAGY